MCFNIITCPKLSHLVFCSRLLSHLCERAGVVAVRGQLAVKCCVCVACSSVAITKNHHHGPVLLVREVLIKLSALS